MPRIRKQTSNRQNTRDRAKITKKAAEQKRKNRKAGKKDVTWKSNKKVDPGVPNSFPFKDQVLAQIAEEKRKSEEEKIARKEAARSSKTQDEEDDAEAPGVSSVGRTVLPRTPLTLTAAAPIVSEESDVPELIDTALPTLQEALDRADVVCEVVDARDILGGRSGYIESLVKLADGKIVLIVNKVDLVPREALQQWLSQLDIPAFLFKSALTVPPTNGSSSKNPGPTFFIEPSTVLGRDELLSAVKKWSAEKKKSKKSDEPLVLTLMGLPSVGKTSILHSLLPPTANKARHAVAPVIPAANSAKQPTPTTKAPVEVEIEMDGLKIKVIDTPGWEPVEEEDDEEKEEEEEEEDLEKWDKLEERLAGDLLRRNLGRVDRVKDVFPLVHYVVKRANHQDLMLAYNIPFFEKGDIQAFLIGLARAQQRIRKHGEPDLEGAGRVILRDWALNFFPYYTTAPASSSMDVDTASGEKYDMSAVLEKCKGKKEMKKESAKGMIRFKASELDGRDIILDDDYTELLTADSDDEDDDEDEELEDGDEMDEDEEDDEEEASDEEEPFAIGSDDGDELDLEDGPEPSSGSDVAEEDEESDSQLELPSPPKSTKSKKRRISEAPVAPVKKAKTVSFAKSVPVEKQERQAKGGKRGRGRK